MNKFTLTIVPFLLLSHIYAGCGGCGPRKTQETVQKGLLETIPRNNYLKGDVLMSCGMCNFNTDENDCRLAIKVGRYVLPVKDVSIDGIHQYYLRLALNQPSLWLSPKGTWSSTLC